MIHNLPPPPRFDDFTKANEMKLALAGRVLVGANPVADVRQRLLDLLCLPSSAVNASALAAQAAGYAAALLPNGTWADVDYHDAQDTAIWKTIVPRHGALRRLPLRALLRARLPEGRVARSQGALQVHDGRSLRGQAARDRARLCARVLGAAAAQELRRERAAGPARRAAGRGRRI